ncbi:type II toxin-antitoxin system HicA family toxin [Cohnella cellulosilytica]|uniref:Type II toxin-antitoxin system HicA family toxin n=1 Tax=Cohnella cellulosilytica TaxID=986710 RepID=A0ABW2F4Y9_9BACL
MSPKFPVVSGKEAASALESIGFVAVSQRGCHKKMRHPSGKTAIVPMHDELAIGTLKSIIRQAGIDADEFYTLDFSITETQLTEAEAMKKLPKLTNKKICPSPIVVEDHK